MASDKRPRWLLLKFWEEHVPLLYHPAILFASICNIANVICCGFYHSRGNLGSLINHVSTCLGKVVSVEKTPMLSLSFSVCMFSINSFSFVLFSFFLFIVSHLNFKCSGLMTRNPRGFFLFISTVSPNDLFNISIHKCCFSLQSSLISSPRDIDVMNSFDFCGKNRTSSVSIWMLVARSVLTVLGEYIINIYFFKCFGCLTPQIDFFK